MGAAPSATESADLGSGTRPLRLLATESVGLGSGARPLRLLMVGCTGSGKTSFLNLLGNIAVVLKHGMHPDAFHKIARINKAEFEENLQSKKMAMQSGTGRATEYRIAFGEVELHVLDTPGFGDCSGIEKDKQHLKGIQKALLENQCVDAICVVINGRVSRQFATEAYVLSEISALLPKACLKNVIVVFTNCASPVDLNYTMEPIEEQIGDTMKGRFFCIDNPFCIVDKVGAMHPTVREVAMEDVMLKFRQATQVLHKMFTCVSAMEQVPTLRFEEVRKARTSVEELVTETLEKMSCMDEVGRELETIMKELPQKLEQLISARELANAKAAHVEDTVEGLSKHRADLTQVQSKVEANQEKLKQLKEQTETHWELEVPKKKGGHHTICTFKKCHNNCHVSCTLDKIDDAAEDFKVRFRSCDAFSMKVKKLKLSNKFDRTALKKLCHEEVSGWVNERGEATNDKATKFMSVTKGCQFKGTELGEGGWFTLGRRVGATMCEVDAVDLPADIWCTDRTKQHICNACGHEAKHHRHLEKVWVPKQVPKMTLNSILAGGYKRAQEITKRAEAKRDSVSRAIANDKHALADAEKEVMAAKAQEEAEQSGVANLETAKKGLEREIASLQLQKDRVTSNLKNKLDEFSKLAVASSYVNILEKQKNVIKERFEAEPQNYMLKDALDILDNQIKLMKKLEGQKKAEPERGMLKRKREKKVEPESGMLKQGDNAACGAARKLTPVGPSAGKLPKPRRDPLGPAASPPVAASVKYGALAKKVSKKAMKVPAAMKVAMKAMKAMQAMK